MPHVILRSISSLGLQKGVPAALGFLAYQPARVKMLRQPLTTESASKDDVPGLTRQLQLHFGTAFKDNQVSPVFLEPALPSPPPKDLSEAPMFVQQLEKHHASIIKPETVKHPFLSVDMKTNVDRILHIAKEHQSSRKTVVVATRGRGLGKTRCMVETQLALMQLEHKNVLPIAITFSNHTKIDPAETYYYSDSDVSYAVMICSRILAAFYAERDIASIQRHLRIAIANLKEPSAHGASLSSGCIARDLYPATVEHVLGRMSNARPGRPIDTVVIMVDDCHLPNGLLSLDYERKFKRRLDFTRYIRSGFLRDFKSQGDRKVDMALCTSSAEPLNFDSCAGHGLRALDMASHLDPAEVVEKWWIPAILGQSKSAAQAWLSEPANQPKFGRLLVLAAALATVPRHLEFALTKLMRQYEQNAGQIDTGPEAIKEVMDSVSADIEFESMMDELAMAALIHGVETRPPPAASYKNSP